MDNFHLKYNSMLEENPDTKASIINVILGHTDVLEGGAEKNQVMGQGAAGRTDWIVAMVELKGREESPVTMKQ